MTEVFGNLGGNAEKIRPIKFMGWIFFYLKKGRRKTMLDLKFIRENPEIVKQNIRNKFQEEKLPLVDEVVELDAKNRATKQEADALRAERNMISKQIGTLMAKGHRLAGRHIRCNLLCGHWVHGYICFLIKRNRFLFTIIKDYQSNACIYLVRIILQ